MNLTDLSSTRGAHSRAPYAIDEARGGVRAHPEPPDPLRTQFELDRHRIIESTAFRRLEHKTQVFAPSFHDHFRTRLTHSLETAQIARCMAANLDANEALSEAVALAHDLGHPPFGHAGEAALDEALTDQGGFNHNAQSLRVVEYLEHPFPSFRGLNLTSATRDGLRTHATQYDRPSPPSNAVEPSGDGGSVEAQIASLADRVAFNGHDLEDAIGAGLIAPDDLQALALWREAEMRAGFARSSRPVHAIRRVVLDGIIDSILVNVIKTSKRNLDPIESPDAVRAAGQTLVSTSGEISEGLGELETFLSSRVYAHRTVREADARGRRMILNLFEAYRDKPGLLPERFRGRIEAQGLSRVIGDYIAGMTDRFCEREHARHCGA